MSERKTPKPYERSGFIYVIECDEYIKIGRVGGGSMLAAAKRMTARFSGLQTGSPHHIDLLAWVWAPNALASEPVLHAHFAHAHVRVITYLPNPGGNTTLAGGGEHEQAQDDPGDGGGDEPPSRGAA